MGNDHDEREQGARGTWIRVRSDALAKEAYARFQVSYEAEHGLRLAGWAALDEGTQARWREMLAPVAQQLAQADENERALRLLEEEHRELRTRADRDAARLAVLEALVDRVSQRLPEAALLAKLPAPLLAALASLSNTAAPVQAAQATVDAEPPAGDRSAQTVADGPSPVGAGVPATAGVDPPAQSDSRPAVEAGAKAPTPGDRSAQAVADGPSPVGAGMPTMAGVDPPAQSDSRPAVEAGAEPLAPTVGFAGLSPELVAELQAAASAFAAEAASIKLPLTSETGTPRARARVRANASQKLIALHKKARDHLLVILDAMLTEDQRASLWPLPDDVFSVAYDVAAILETVGGKQASATPPSPPSGDETRGPQPWGRALQVEARLAAVGLADLDAFTDAQLGQAGGIVAEVLGLDVNPAAQVTLGKVGVAFTRAFASVRNSAG